MGIQRTNGVGAVKAAGKSCQELVLAEMTIAEDINLTRISQAQAASAALPRGGPDPGSLGVKRSRPTSGHGRLSWL